MASSDHNIIRLFLQAAAAHPHRMALIMQNRRITFGELLKQVKQTAGYFQTNGIKDGDAVLVFVPVSIDLYRTVLALFYVGAVPVFLDEWVSLDRVKQCCKLVAPKAIIAPRKILWLTWLIKPFRNISVRLSTAGFDENTTILNEPQHKKEGDAALITFTTGTTATPKAAIRTHGILAAQFSALSPLLQPQAWISLTLLPVVVLLHIGLGKTTVLSSINPRNYKKGDAQKLVHLIKQEKINSIVASPFIVLQLANYCIQQNRKTPVTEVITGGGPLFPEEAALVTQAFTEAKTIVVYGSTEAEPISHIAGSVLAQMSQHIERQGLPVGRIDCAAMVAIIPFKQEPFEPMTQHDWQQLQLPAGGVGEIVVAGNHVVAHYVLNKEAERLYKIYVDGTVWHRTGDSGRLDENGNLFLYGPCNEVVQHDGKMAYPFLIAHGVRHVTGIADAALFKKDGTAILAISVTAAFKQADLARWLEQHQLTGIKIIRLPAIPKDARHRTKIDYKRLREMCRL